MPLELRVAQRSLRKEDFHSEIIGIGISPDGKNIFVADRDNVWKLNASTGNGNEIYDIPNSNHGNGDAHAQFNADCTRVAVAQMGKLVVYDIDRQRVLHTSERWLPSLTFAPGHNTLFFAETNDIEALSLDDDQVETVTSDQMSYCESIDIAADGRRAVTGTGRSYPPPNDQPDSHRVRVWDLHNGQLLHDLQDHRQWVWAVRFTADGKQIISAGGGSHDDWGGIQDGADHAIRLWDAETG